MNVSETNRPAANQPKTERPPSLLMQRTDEICEDLNAILRDLQDMKKATALLEAHLLY